MKKITDCRPSALLKEIGWGTGSYVIDANGSPIWPEVAACSIRLGRADKLKCMCATGAINVSGFLGGIDFDKLMRLRTNLKDLVGNNIEQFNDMSGMTAEKMIGYMEKAEQLSGITEPVPVPDGSFAF